MQVIAAHRRLPGGGATVVKVGEFFAVLHQVREVDSLISNSQRLEKILNQIQKIQKSKSFVKGLKILNPQSF